MCSGIFRCSHLQRSYRASGKSSVCVQEPVRSIEAGWEVGIDHTQSGECAFFLDAHLSWSFRLVSGPGLSGPHNCIAENRSYSNVSRDGIFGAVFLLYKLWMDAEGANNVAKSFAEFASRKAIQRQFGPGGYQVAANISDSDCDVLARSMTGVSSSSYIKGPPAGPTRV